MALKGIDVSKWNGTIDWKKVKESGIQFAIIKAGGADDGFYQDSKFEENYKGAKAAGIPVGAYYFNSASFTSKERGIEEAKHCISLLKGKQFEWPIFCDIEAQDYKQKKGITEATVAFCEHMEDNGFWVGVYGSDLGTYDCLVDYEATAPYSRWIARYGSPISHKSYAIHQHTNKGSVNGISGYVDMNESYVDFTPLVKGKKLNGWTEEDARGTFVPRFTKPEAGNPYYNNAAKGGWSPCITGKPTDSGCNVLSNCVGYALGRFNEIGQYGSCKYARSTNAENFVEACKAQGLKIGTTPKLGAIIVWQKGATLRGSDGAGHVAVVEQVNSDGSIITSESGWNSAAFWTKTRKAANNWGAGSGYTFRGFIYHPIDFEAGGKVEEKTETKVETPAVSAPTASNGVITSQKVSISKVVYGEKAKEFNADIYGTYKTTTGLNIRSGAGTSYASYGVLSAGTVCYCLGLYTTVEGVKWYQVQTVKNGVYYTGFCSSQYLQKV